MKSIVRKLIQKFGFDVVRHNPLAPDGYLLGLDSTNRDILDTIHFVRPYTMTSTERLFALIQATEYIIRANIVGSIVECGVWRGGSMMAVAHTLKRLGRQDVDLFCFDTFEGMSQPTEVDISYTGDAASAQFLRSQVSEGKSQWCHGAIQEVQRNLESSGYDKTRMICVKGKVEDTLPEAAPGAISILRLDTDWYESTRHELLYLFPKLSVGGVLILDDYGHWQGARKAVDEYMEQHGIQMLLNRIDYTGRVGVKM